MNAEFSDMKRAKESCRTIDEVAELYSVNRWTIRMWMNRFDIPGHTIDSDGGILFTHAAVEQIGTICRLMKMKMKLEDVREYLKSEFVG
jgi:DNA-binding transcriptional MerR regulator